MEPVEIPSENGFDSTRITACAESKNLKKSNKINFEDTARITTTHPNTLNEGVQQRLYRILEHRHNHNLRIIISHIVKNHHFECSVATALKYATQWGFYRSRHNKSKQKHMLVEQKKKVK